MSITETLGIDHIMRQPGRIERLPAHMAERIPTVSKKRGRPRKTAAETGQAARPPSSSEDARAKIMEKDEQVSEFLEEYGRNTPDVRRAVEVMTAEYARQRLIRDEAQAKMTYLDLLYQQMTDNGAPLDQLNGANP